mgnify:CR=1 FL=1
MCDFRAQRNGACALHRSLIPQILNTVQALVDENKKLKFYLTGSSARKLKKGGENLLPGRVLNFNLGPLTIKELNYKINKEDLMFGFLPGVYSENDKALKKEILSSYSANYVNEEIKSEALVKNLPSFSRFLEATPSPTSCPKISLTSKCFSPLI